VHHGAVIATEGGHVIDCAGCGYAHVDPLPGQSDLDALYTNAFYESDKPDYLAKTESERNYWRSVYFDRLNRIERLRDRGRILDVGCSGGWFLECAVEHGWDALGIEPAPLAVEFARNKGLQVLESTYDRAPADIGRFDAIHAALVLEHLLDAGGFVRWAYRHLERGGLLCVETPNDFNRLQAVLHSNGFPQYWVAPDHHVNYFTFDSLEGLLESEGFDIVARSAQFPMELFLLLGYDYVADPGIGPMCHTRRMEFESALRINDPDLLSGLYDALAALAIGREAVVYGVK